MEEGEREQERARERGQEREGKRERERERADSACFFWNNRTQWPLPITDVSTSMQSTHTHTYVYYTLVIAYARTVRSYRVIVYYNSSEERFLRFNLTRLLVVMNLSKYTRHCNVQQCGGGWWMVDGDGGRWTVDGGWWMFEVWEMRERTIMHC